MKRYLKYLRNITEVGLATAKPAGGSLWGFVKTMALVLCLGMITAGLMSMKPVLSRSAGGNEVWKCGGVNIAYANGNLQQVAQTADGVCGLVMTGVSESGGYTLGTPTLVTDMTDVATAGITVGNNPFAIKHLQEFYNQAGNGADLYVMLVPNTVTVAAMALNTNTTNGMGVLANFAGGKIKFMGIISDDTVGTAPTITDGLNAAVATAATNAAVTVAAFQAAEMPFRVLIGGTSYSGTASALTDYSTGTTNNMCSIIIGDTNTTYSSKGAAVGLFLGAKAPLPAQRKNSRTLNGALTTGTAYLNTTQLAMGNNDPTTISNKHYITFTMYPQQTGIYFTSDWTLTTTADDYCYLVRGFVIDKARVLGYAMYFQLIDDEIPSVAGTGLIDPGFAASLDTNIENYINENMTAVGNITGCTSFTTPTQNVVENEDVSTVLSIGAVGYAGTIDVQLGYEL